MRNRLVRAVISVTLAACAWLVTSAPPAAAHEDRQAEGLDFVVGWGDEPTYTGFKNSVQLVVSRPQGGPVTDLRGDVEVEVIHADASTTLPMEPNFYEGASGEPGDFRAWLTPTRPGDYTFHFTGTIMGKRINERFTSGEDTFSPVLDVSSIQFPAKDPSTGALAERTDREIARLRSQLAGERRTGNEDGGTPAVAWVALGASLVSLIGLAVIGAGGARKRA
jgi:hypothetical protein